MNLSACESVRRGCATRIAALCVALGIATPVVCGHGELHEQIAAVSALIAEHPRQVRLYLKRGELHRLHKDWRAAAADFERAAEVDAGAADLSFRVARVKLDSGAARDAKLLLDQCLTKNRVHSAALLVRADALARLGQPLDAAADLGRAIQLLDHPRPEHYLERARLLRSVGGAHIGQAVQTLDDGIRTLGPIVTLELAAIEIETSTGRFDGALARIDKLLSASPRRERWLLRRGLVLEHARRFRAARGACVGAQDAIAALPARLRDTPAVRELRDQIRAALERLHTKETR